MRQLLAACVLLIAIAACGDDGGDKPRDAAPTGDVTPSDAGVDSPGQAADASIGALCGAVTCMSTQVCCTGASTTCVAPGNCPTQNFQCDGAEDCAGGKCCFGNQGAGGSECKAATTNCNDVACHGDAECGGSTPKCCPKMFTPSYKVCLAACP
ncbi:MAG: hypothetical protein H0T89_02105 [Deltaproteobacteria bacterium]|nr:hypothetical protein [Deltaproteobacteria bacterium]MDQ3297994.1 hypothetical protein [Myxococcota bacterium]